MLILYLVQGDCTPWPLLRDASNSVWCSENLIDTQCFDDLVFTLLPQMFELNRFFSVLISRPYGTLKYLTVLQINQQFMMKIKEKMELKQFQNKKLLCTLRQFFSKQQARRFCKFQFFAKSTLPLHLSTVYFSHLSYIRDQLRKCIHISKPLIVISSCCRWNKQIIILSFVKKIFRFF